VAVTEIGSGSFAYSLAAMGGFNYVSKEIAPNPDDPFGFYSMQKDKLALIGDHDMKEDVESQALHFMDDLKQLKQRSEKAGRRHWFIFLMGTTKTSEHQVHLWRLATDKANKMSKLTINNAVYGSTVMADDEAKLQSIFNGIKEKLADHSVEVDNATQPIATGLDNNNVLKSVLPSNIMCRMGGGVDCNALTMRVGYEILVYSNRHLLVVKDMANAIKSVIEPEKEIDAKVEKSYLSEGDGYADNYGESVEFKSDPAELQALIDEGCREARQRFEMYDLDGKIEPVIKKGWRERMKSLFS
jgi:hypothetical protein